MKIAKTTAMLALALGASGLTCAYASAPDEREVWELLKKSSMEKRSDTMGKNGNAMGSAQDSARLLDPNLANP